VKTPTEAEFVDCSLELSTYLSIEHWWLSSTLAAPIEEVFSLEFVAERYLMELYVFV